MQREHAPMYAELRVSGLQNDAPVAVPHFGARYGFVFCSLTHRGRGGHGGKR